MSEGIAVIRETAGVDVSKYMYQIRKLKDALVTATSERDTARSERDKAAKELGDIKVKTDSSAIVKENATLKAKLATIEHRKVLDEKALAAGFKKEALDAFYKLSEYEAQGEPDPDEIGAFVDSKKEALGFLIGETKTETTEEPTRRAVNGSGQRKTQNSTGFQLPPPGDPKWSDASWQWENADKIAAASRSNMERGILDGAV